MPFLPRYRKEHPGTLPIHEPKRSEETATSNMDEEKKGSTSITSPITSKPPPARTASSRPSYQPTRTASAAKSKRTVSTTSTKAASSKKPERPGLERQKTMAQTRYVEMLLNLDDIPKLHNILASLFTWILLAGYIVFPATFNNIQKDQKLDDHANSELKKHALRTVRNVPLLWIAAFACGIGVLGCVWLWWKYKRNYVWVINRIFLPALMNSIAGLISTLVNIYSAQEGQYSVTAKATITVTSACSVVAAALFLIYNSIMLAVVKKRHDKQTKAVERSMSQRQVHAAEREKEQGILGAVGADPGRVV